jgi:membrane protein insertase Oxa1/YidC/SpoIIIJ
MGYLALTFASGLALYFVASNLFTIGQYAAMGKLDLKNLGSLLPRIPGLSTGVADKARSGDKKSAADKKPALESKSTENVLNNNSKKDGKQAGGKKQYGGRKHTPDKASGRRK